MKNSKYCVKLHMPKPQAINGHCEWNTCFFQIVFPAIGEKGPYSIFPRRFQYMFVRQAVRVEEFFRETFLLQYDLASKAKTIPLLVAVVSETERKRLKMPGIAHVVYPKPKTYSPLVGKDIGKNTPVVLWTSKALKLTNPLEVKHVARHEIVHAFLNSFVFSSLGHSNSKHKREFVENLVDFIALFSARGTEKTLLRLIKRQG